MSRKIAVEQNLTPVREFLSEKGYSVDAVNIGKEFTRELEKYDAVVVTGMNKDFLGVQDVNTGAVIIDAKGLTAEQVLKEMESRLQ